MNLQGAILVVLTILTLTVAWAIVEIRALHASIGPVATSPLARALSGIGT